MKKNKNLFIVIIGCGRLGSHLANKLSFEGNSVVVVDVKKSTFNVLSPEFSGFKLEGDATEFAVLKEAEIDKADILIAATGRDNVNLMVCQVAKEIFRIPKVIARVVEPERQEIYNKLNIETICPTLIASDAFFITITKPDRM